MPFQVTKGNHDIGYEYSATDPVSSDNLIQPPSEHYTKGMIWFDKLLHYNLPGLKTAVHRYDSNDTTDYYSHYYSFDYGSVHVSVLDYENLFKYCNTKDTAYVGKQLRWLVNDLKATTKIWKVLMVHAYDEFQSGYSIPFNYGGIFTDNTIRTTKLILDAIVSKEKVTVVLDGHYHWNCQDTIVSNGGKNYFHLRSSVGGQQWAPTSPQAFVRAYWKFTFNGNSLTCLRLDTLNKITLTRKFKLDPTLNIVNQ